MPDSSNRQQCAKPSWRARLGVAAIGTLLAMPAAAQSLFDADDVLQIRLEAPLTTLSRERMRAQDIPGTLIVDGVAVAVELRARGKFRRRSEICSFPPIRLDFDDDSAAGTVFGQQDKLKLVTHCRTSSSYYEQLVLREYLAYRILGMLTERSLRVRLLRVSYRDTDRNDEAFERWGFVIEDEDAFGARVGLERRKEPALTGRDLAPAHTSLVTLFEYMIGNTDYSLTQGAPGTNCCHNTVPYSDGASTWPVPYDFDFSGFVNAPYAEPDPRFRIRSVTVRVYRGICSQNAYLPESIGRFQAGRERIYAMVNGQDGLDDRDRRNVLRYLDRFYAIISDARQVDRQLVRQCS